MMKAIAKFFGAASASQMDALARQVAEGSVDSVCELVSTQVESMTFSEARGYVRARSTQIVRKQARKVIGRNAKAEASHLVETVARAAVERIVPLVLRQTGVGVPKTATPIRLAA